MKLSLTLPEPLVARLEAEADRRRTTVSDVIVDAVRRMLDEAPRASAPFRIPAFELGVPTVDIADRDELYDFFDRKG